MEDNSNLGMGIDDEVNTPQIEEMYTPPQGVDLNKQHASQNTGQSSVPVYGQPQNGTNPYNGVSYGDQGNMQYGQNPYGQPRTPYGQPVTGTFDEYEVMHEKGRKLAMGVAITYIVLAGLSILGSLGGFSAAPAKSAGQILGSILNIYFAYCFMNGGNKTRLFFGITSIISAVGYLGLLLIFGGTMSELGTFGTAYTTLLTVILIPVLGFSGFVIWATMFNKNVKAFCGAL